MFCLLNLFHDSELHAVKWGGIDEGDEGRIAATTEAAKLLDCILPSDLRKIRGKVHTCDKLMGTQLGSTNGVLLPFENGRGAKEDGEGDCFRSSLHCGLSWLWNIYQKLWNTIDLKELLPIIGTQSLAQQQTFQLVRSSTEKRCSLDECASNL